ncbi:chromosome partition protein Smc-like [Drosophila tropicalis]|uniref:chromosome partition protein Smc-like n=1 Tax=Drosophila tropicalis TaxID=46794 RepID=UPI0035ABD4D4
MDQAILNLMLSNVDASPEDPSSETSSIIDGFELMNTQCEGNCYQKLKSLLQQAAKLIKLKDQQIESKDRQIESKDSQIDNHVRTISTLSMKCLDIHKHYMENQMAEKGKEISDLVLKYAEQLKEANAPSNKTNEILEIPKEQLENQLADQTRAREQDELNALLEESKKKVENLIAQLSEAEIKLKEANTFLEESHGKVKMLEVEKQKMENKLTSKINQNEILIKNYQTKIEKAENKEYIADLHIANFFPRMVTINNDIAGPGWLVVVRRELQNGSLERTINIGSNMVYSLTKDQPHELYIHLKNKHESTSFAHCDNFALDQDFKIKSLGAVRSSMAITEDFCGSSFESIMDFYGYSNCIASCTLMIRQKLKYQLPPRSITE